METQPSSILPMSDEGAPGLPPSPKDTNGTPMLRQYQSLKSQYPDCILFFRLGDFYEMFFEDAKIASGILELVLTSRGKASNERIPMCGIPYHAADAYIAKLIKAGLKIAICEQMEDPKLAKGIVKRDIIRVITSGTFLDDATADTRYILSLVPAANGIGLAFTDITNGNICANQFENSGRAVELLSKLPFCECIFPANAQDRVKEILKHPLLRSKNITLSPYEDWAFNSDIARKTLLEHFKTNSLRGFGIEELNLAQASAGALLEYLRAMNKQPLDHIDRISLYTDDDYAFISSAACRGLELEELFKFMDRTLTPMGKRKLKFWLYHPLKDMDAILKRQEAVSLLVARASSLATRDPSAETRVTNHESRATGHEPPIKLLNQLLRHTPDIEKSISRLSCGYTSHKDILFIRNTLVRIPALQSAVKDLAINNELFTINDLPQLRELLDKAINPDVPLAHAEGKIIRKGYHTELDSLREIQENGRQWLKKLQEEEIKRTGINSLKVGFNQVFGYYIEITKANLGSVPNDYIRKQTLVNGERYITPQLKEFEEKILTAEEKISKIENEILLSLQKEILIRSAALHDFASGLATLDCLHSLCALADDARYIAPQITENDLIQIKDGRHPVVESTLLASFVPNDTLLDCQDNHLIILTGPNMAGKSTYIRQTAILVVMAQMGSYIPAGFAAIGIVDKIFSRIGAHDDITKGQSTFMVEMNETADILNNLSPKSLVILDEIGRGTSTFDGLSLAWALAEHFQKQKVRTLFATHFHELTALADERSGIKNYNVAVKEWKDEIVFLHKIIPGSTDDSYGIYVAKLAGIPKGVINRSKQILTQLELQGNLKERLTAGGAETQLSLFASGAAPDSKLEEIKVVIEAMNVNELTPLAALNELNKLKQMLDET